jgi:hypothetical protein
MKPSERIAQLIAEAAASVQEQVNRTGGFELNFGDILRPVVRYLDEQAEIEQRRTHVRNALAMLGSYPGASRRVNEALETAGLKTRVSDGQPLSDCASCIVDEATREGLF